MAKNGVFDTNKGAITTITDNTKGGLLVDNMSIATVRSATIKNNDYANVYLSFGSHGDFENNTIDGRIRCDKKSTTLTRGDEQTCKKL